MHKTTPNRSKEMADVPLHMDDGDKYNKTAPKNVATSSSYAETLHKFLPSVFIPTESSDRGARLIYESTINRISAYALSISVFCLAIICIIIAIFDEQFGTALPLFLICFPAGFSLFWLKDKDRNPKIPLLVLGFAMTMLCSYLLVGDGPADGSTMIWVAIFPTIIVLCLGLVYGFISFFFLYIFMLLLFLTPLGSLMTITLSEGMKVRLMVVCLGTFGFVWCLEFARFRANLALHLAAYKIEQTSLTDTLTGLGNRRDFDRSLAWTLARVERNAIPFALAILDIDHFKKVNDTYGHAVGDEVLKFIAHEVETQIRTADRLFRWGGEEFAIIMPATTMDMAMAGAERVRKHIESNPFSLGNGQIKITVSLGIYSGLESKDPAYPLHIADQCLYKAKSTGRNKVVGGE